MKKIFFLISVLSLSVATFAQTNPLSGKNNIQTAPSSSIAEFQIETKQFALNITIENASILEDLVLKPSDNYQQMYLNGNWGTIAKKISFNKDIKKQTVQFIVAYRVVKIGDFYKLYEEGVSCDKLKEFRNEKIFEDVKTKKLSAQVQFKTSSGEIIKKDLEINFDKNSSEGGDEVFATAKITDKDLGVNVISLKVNTEELFFKFWLRNEEYGVNMVVDPKNNNNTTKVSVLAGKAMPDGVYSFVCRIGLPNGMQKEEIVEAFVVNNEISISANSFNPLSFTRDTKYGGSYFNGKITVVKIKNTRSSSIIVFLPTDYVVGRATFTTGKTEIQTEAFSQNGSGWVSYVIPAGESIKVKMKVGAFPIIVHDLNRNNSDIVMVGLMSKNFQYLDIGWGRRFTLRAR